MRFEESADPRVQLEQAVAEATEQHRRLRDQAANVIANQKQTEMRLNRALEELERTHVNAHQALRMADDAQRGNDTVEAQRYNDAAESLAAKLLDLEGEVGELRDLYLQATTAANQAKAAVDQNSVALKAKLAERQKLLNQLDQAQLQEQMNKAMATLSESVGQDVSTFDEVRQKIEARYAKAKGVAELSSTPTDTSMLEIEQASKRTEARARLDQMRAELGLSSKNASQTRRQGLPELEP
jgi:phage shock protein A